MHNSKRFMAAMIALAMTSPAFATNLFGDTVNNNQTYNQPKGGEGGQGGEGGHGGHGGQGGAGGSGTGVGVGVGVGVGTGIGTGGNATGGNATGGNANVDNRNTNTNTALGGQGGTGIGVGGNAAQGQQQGQGQQQANYGVNSQGQGQSLTNNSATSTNTATNTSTNTATNSSTNTATSQGQNQSANNNGNAQSTNVNYNEAAQPDRIRVDQAPTVYTSAPNATVSCYKTAGGGFSAWFGGASFSGGAIDEACETRELVRLTTDAKAANSLLCTFEVYQLANRDACAGVPIIHMLSQRTRNAIVRPEGE